MRRRARGGKEKGSIDKRVNDLLYRSLPASSRFLPASVHTYRGRSKLEQLRSFVGWTGRGETSRYVRSPYFLDYFVPDTTKLVALCRIIQRYARGSYEALSGK